MKPPRPSTLRLLTRASDAAIPPAPFGLTGWDPAADAVAVLVDATDLDLEDVAAVAEQVPAATEVPPGALVAILAGAVRTTPVWRRLLGAGRVIVPCAVRCAALLVRGYVDVGARASAQPEREVSWGYAPLRQPRSPSPDLD